MHDFEDGIRGVIALEDIKKNSVLMYVPESLHLTHESASHSVTLNKLKELGITLANTYDVKKHINLAIFLLEESNNPDSVW